MLGLEQRPDSERRGLNHAMHFGQAMLLGDVHGRAARQRPDAHKSVYAFTTGLIADALAEDPPARVEARS